MKNVLQFQRKFSSSLIYLLMIHVLPIVGNNQRKNFHLIWLFCLAVSFIWTLVSIVLLDPWLINASQSIPTTVIKMMICTCPSLFSLEISCLFLLPSPFDLSVDEIHLILIKWLIFFSMMCRSFWNGTLLAVKRWFPIDRRKTILLTVDPFYIVYDWLFPCFSFELINKMKERRDHGRKKNQMGVESNKSQMSFGAAKFDRTWLTW